MKIALTLFLLAAGFAPAHADVLQGRQRDGETPEAALARFGFVPVNKAGDQFNGTLTFNPFLGGRQITIGSHGVASSVPDIAFYAQSDEAWTVPPGSFATLGSFVLNTGGAATGERSALNATWQGKGSFTPNSNLVAAGFTSHLTGGTGSSFGINPVCWLDVQIQKSASCIGEEIDTTVDAPATGKIGLQIVDTSHVATPFAANVDAGIVFVKGSNNSGFQHAISIGYDPANVASAAMQGLGAQADIISTATMPRLASGFDLSKVKDWSFAPIVLAPGAKGIWWGRAHQGGSISSLATESGADIGLASRGVRLSADGVEFASISGSALNFSAASLTGPRMSISIGGGIKASEYAEKLRTPANGNAPCSPGQFTDDAHFHYVCTETNVWKKTTLRPFAVLKVAALPRCDVALEGAMYPVSDAAAPTYNAALVGGGSAHIPAYCDGKTWTAH